MKAPPILFLFSLDWEKIDYPTWWGVSKHAMMHRVFLEGLEDPTVIYVIDDTRLIVMEDPCSINNEKPIIREYNLSLVEGEA
jgi:hypothetical protein